MFASLFLTCETRLGITFHELSETDRDLLSHAYESVQLAGMAFALGTDLDATLWRLMAGPWRALNEGRYPEEEITSRY